MPEEIPAYSLFMMCEDLDERACSDIPEGYSIRSCRQAEYGLWKGMHVDNPAQADEYYKVLDEYFDLVYAPQGSLFFEKCRFICDENDVPAGTCFIWKSYGEINTIHWLKILKEHENKGLGRALMSCLMEELSAEEYPVFLHTHPTSYRAVKLYSDFGFKLITDKTVGFRSNNLEESLPYLKRHMPQKDYSNLGFTQAPPYFLEAVRKTEYEQF